jgi:sporulation protein YlmC with PRC-barrel domain
MIRFAFAGLVSVLAAAGPALAQQTQDPAKDPASTAAPAPSAVPISPDLTVASVKRQGGSRISKLLGSSVFNDQNEKVGTLDDLIMKDGNKVVMAVVSVGGFLGIGNKLVAIPYDQLRLEENKDEQKVTMPGGSKDVLNAMPTFTYSG